MSINWRNNMDNKKNSNYIHKCKDCEGFIHTHKGADGHTHTHIHSPVARAKRFTIIFVLS